MENAVNNMKNWASLVEKEAFTSEQWNTNWGAVFFPNGTPTVEDKIKELEEKAKKLNDQLKEAQIKGPMNLETFETIHYKKHAKDISPAFPFCDNR